MSGDNNKNKPDKIKSLKEIFLSIANIDNEGFSEEILISKLILIDSRFETKNGGDWCRTDGPLKEFNIVRKKVKNKIFSVKLDGYNKNIIEKAINPTISKEIKKRKCAVLAIGSGIECDHKDGMYDDSSVSNTSTQTINDFQPLNRNVNLAKRQHCKVCREDNIRFDAKKLGYSQSYIKGDEKTKSCKGCYWYDPILFNETISRDFIKDR